MSKINHRSPIGYFDIAPSLQWGKEDEQVAGAVALIFVVIFRHRPRLCWQRQARFLGLLLAALIKATKGYFGL